MTMSVHRLPSHPPVIAVCDYERGFDTEEGNALPASGFSMLDPSTTTLSATEREDFLNKHWGNVPIKIFVSRDPEPSAPLPQRNAEGILTLGPEARDESFILLVKRRLVRENHDQDNTPTSLGFASIALYGSPEGEALQKNPSVMEEIENLIEEEVILASSCLFYGVTPEEGLGDPLTEEEARDNYQEAEAEYIEALQKIDVELGDADLSLLPESESESDTNIFSDTFSGLTETALSEAEQQKFFEAEEEFLKSFASLTPEEQEKAQELIDAELQEALEELDKIIEDIENEDIENEDIEDEDIEDEDIEDEDNDQYQDLENLSGNNDEIFEQEQEDNNTIISEELHHELEVLLDRLSMAEAWLTAYQLKDPVFRKNWINDLVFTAQNAESDEDEEYDEGQDEGQGQGQGENEQLSRARLE